MAFSIDYRLNSNGYTELYLTALDQSGNFIHDYSTLEIDNLQIAVSKSNGDSISIYNENTFEYGFRPSDTFDGDSQGFITLHILTLLVPRVMIMLCQDISMMRDTR